MGRKTPIIICICVVGTVLSVLYFAFPSKTTSLEVKTSVAEQQDFKHVSVTLSGSESDDETKLNDLVFRPNQLNLSAGTKLALNIPEGFFKDCDTVTIHLYDVAQKSSIISETKNTEEAISWTYTIEKEGGYQLCAMYNDGGENKSVDLSGAAIVTMYHTQESGGGATWVSGPIPPL